MQNKKIFFIVSLITLCSLLFSCKEDLPANKNKKAVKFDLEKTIPLNFGESWEQVKASSSLLNKALIDEKTHICTISLKGSELETVFESMSLYFDLNSNYQYASLEAIDDKTLKEESFYQLLKKENWNSAIYKTADDEKIFSKGELILRIFPDTSWAVKKPMIIIGKDNQQIESWMRLKNLEDPNLGCWTPLTAFGCNKSLFDLYESFCGHHYKEDRSKPEKGFFAYDTGNPKFPMVAYFYNEKSNSYMDECSLYMDYDNPPKPEEVHKYILSLGFFDTGLKDDDKNKLYYNRTTKITCRLYMNNPKKLGKDKFNPRLEFMYTQDIENKLPQEKVDFPWPYTKFDVEPMENVIKWYENKGYKVTPSDGFYQIKDQNKDFPLILLFTSDKNEKFYGGAFLFARDMKVLLSSDIIKQILDHGYTLIRQEPIPTFINKDENSQIQISESEGGIGFNAIGA